MTRSSSEGGRQRRPAECCCILKMQEAVGSIFNLTIRLNNSRSSAESMTCPSCSASPPAQANATTDLDDLQDDSKHKVYWALLLIVLPVMAIFGNILVIVSVYREKSLQSVTNYFIVSLAFADLLVGGVVMPFALYFLVSRPCQSVAVTRPHPHPHPPHPAPRFISSPAPSRYNRRRRHRSPCAWMSDPRRTRERMARRARRRRGGQGEQGAAAFC